MEGQARTGSTGIQFVTGHEVKQQNNNGCMFSSSVTLRVVLCLFSDNLALLWHTQMFSQPEALQGHKRGRRLENQGGC